MNEVEILHAPTLSDLAVRDALIVSEVHFLRDSLAEVLTRETSIGTCRQAATIAEALVCAGALRPAIVLLDVAFPGGGHHAVILPISDKKLKSTIPGIHFTADAYELTMANDVRVVAWCTSRSSPAS